MATKRSPVRRSASAGKKSSARSSNGRSRESSRERDDNRDRDRDNDRDRGRDRDDNRDRGRDRDEKAEWTNVTSLRESRRNQDVLTGRVQEDKLEAVIARLQEILDADAAAQFVVNMAGKYGPFVSLTQGEKYEAREGGGNGGGRGGYNRGGGGNYRDRGNDRGRGRDNDRGGDIDDDRGGSKDSRDDRF